MKKSNAKKESVLELKFDENKEITDYEIVNVEIVGFEKMREETQIIDDHYYSNDPENANYFNQLCNEESFYFRKLLFERYGI